jgi:hypothetical protein
MAKLFFPYKGINKNWGVSDTPQYTSPDMLNVRPRDTLQGRIRGGQRPGLTKLYATDLGGPVAAMCMITRIDDNA